MAVKAARLGTVPIIDAMPHCRPSRERDRKDVGSDGKLARSSTIVLPPPKLQVELGFRHNVTNDNGSEPESAFPLRSKFVSAVMVANMSGMVPVKYSPTELTANVVNAVNDARLGRVPENKTPSGILRYVPPTFTPYV